MRFFALFCWLSFLGVVPLSYAQKIGGTLLDQKDQEPISGAILQVNKVGERAVQGYAISDVSGGFVISLPATLSSTDSVCLTIRSVGYKVMELRGPLRQFTATTKQWLLEPEVFQLREVQTHAPRVRVRPDTITYNASQLQQSGDRSVEDLLRRIPGITVDARGMVSYHNQPIGRLYIEDLDLLKGRYAVATRNISPDDVASIDIYNNHQHIKALQGTSHSDKTALNIRLKQSSRLRPIGYLLQGLGYGKSPILYRTELFSLFVHSNRQHLLLGKGNNMGIDVGSELEVYTGPSTTNYSSLDDFLDNSPLPLPPLYSAMYADNSDQVVSVNSIYRLPSSLLLTHNVDLKGIKSRMDQYQQSHYVMGNEQIDLVDRASTLHLTRSARSQLSIERNEPYSFVNTEVTLEGRMLGHRFDVEMGEASAPLHEKIEGWDVHLFAKTNYIRRLYSGGVTTINNTVDWHALPDRTLAVTGGALPLRSQSLGGHMLRTFTEVKQAWTFANYWTLNLASTLIWDWTTMHSALEQGGAALARNDLQGYQLLPRIVPELTYKRKDYNAKLSVPMGLSVLRLTDHVEGIPIHRTLLQPDMRLSMGYQWSSYFSTYGSVGYGRSSQGVMHYVSHPMLVSYRLYRTPGSLGHNDIHRMLGSIGLNYNNHPYQRVGNLMLSLMRTTSGQLHDLSITTDAQSHTTYRDLAARRQIFSLSGYFSQGLHSLSSVFKVTAGYNYFDQNISRKGVELMVKSDALHLRSEFTTFWIPSILMSEITGSYAASNSYIQNSSQQKEPTLSQEWTVVAHVVCTPAPSWVVKTKWEANWQRTGKQDYKFFPYGTVSMAYRPTQSRWEIEAAVRNITDQREYTTLRQREMDTFLSAYRLRPREVSVTLRFQY